MRVVRSRTAVAVLLAALFLTLPVLCASALSAVAQTPVPPIANRAGLVVAFGDGSVETRCVSFDEPQIGGDELLERSGLMPVFGFSFEVCAIRGQGCPADDCFCACPFPACEYWANFHLIEGQWEYSQVGAYAYAVDDGDVEGWAWGPGDFTSAAEPPLIPFDQICPAIEPSATPTPTPTATPAPLPPAEIPEPATLILAAAGVAALGGWAMGARRRSS